MNLKELAGMLNLSQTTVSRALNGYPEVSEATRQRVLHAVDATGYRPNRAAQRLATGRAGSIGLVMPIGQQHDTDLHFAEILSGLSQVAVENDVQLVINPSLPEDEESTFEKLAHSGNVDALLLSYLRDGDNRVETLKRLPIPFVVHGRLLGDEHDYPFMDIDNGAAFKNAARLMIELGHRRFALMNGPADQTFAIRRLRGTSDALVEAGLTIDGALTSHEAMTEENGYRTMMRFLGVSDPPTAVLCSSMVLALGAVRALNQCGLSIGSDISIIAHDDVFPYLKPENFSTPITTTTSSLRQAGARLAERLIAESLVRSNKPLQEIWKTDLIVRDSTGRAPADRRKPARRLRQPAH